MKNRLRPNDVRAARRAGMAAAVMAGVIAGGIAAVPADAATAHKAGRSSYRHHYVAFERPELKRGTLIIEGTRAGDRIALRLKAGRPDILQIDAGDDGSADFSVRRKFVARIRHNQLHLLRLVNELLDLAKIESGQFPLTIASAPVRSIVESVSNMIEPQIRSKQLSFEALYGEKDLCVLADRERVEQILLNLLSNAVKFTPAGGSITISTSHSNDEILLHVRDSGPGVPADKQEEIFQPFVQIHSLTPGMSRGTGLGLAISRELARAMAGDLSVKSEPDSGSTFTLCLPRIQ